MQVTDADWNIAPRDSFSENKLQVEHYAFKKLKKLREKMSPST